MYFFRFYIRFRVAKRRLTLFVLLKTVVLRLLTDKLLYHLRWRKNMLFLITAAVHDIFLHGTPCIILWPPGWGLLHGCLLIQEQRPGHLTQRLRRVQISEKFAKCLENVPKIFTQMYKVIFNCLWNIALSRRKDQHIAGCKVHRDMPPQRGSGSDPKKQIPNPNIKKPHD